MNSCPSLLPTAKSLLFSLDCNHITCFIKHNVNQLTEQIDSITAAKAVAKMSRVARDPISYFELMLYSHTLPYSPVVTSVLLSRKANFQFSTRCNVNMFILLKLIVVLLGLHCNSHIFSPSSTFHTRSIESKELTAIPIRKLINQRLLWKMERTFLLFPEELNLTSTTPIMWPSN